jgi:excisionase family DNA binding protein
MTLRKQLHSLSRQLAELHDEQMDRFDQTLFTIRHAYELAVKHHAADAINIARRVTGPLSPGEGRAILASMIASVPADESPTMSVPQAAELLGISKETVYRLCSDGVLAHARIRNRITITPQQLEQYRREVER